MLFFSPHKLSSFGLSTSMLSRTWPVLPNTRKVINHSSKLIVESGRTILQALTHNIICYIKKWGKTRFIMITHSMDEGRYLYRGNITYRCVVVGKGVQVYLSDSEMFCRYHFIVAYKRPKNIYFIAIWKFFTNLYIVNYTVSMRIFYFWY